MNEILLGFHLRSRLGHFKDEWSVERRKTFLIDENIKIPLSIDHAVWPESTNQQLRKKLFYDYNGPRSVQNGLMLFNIKSSDILMQSSCNGELCLIAITVVNDENNCVQMLRASHKIKDIPYTIENLKNAGWIRLGFDVADFWMYSGLMNCGYQFETKVSYWKRYINTFTQHGLFINFEDADGYRIKCDSRVQGHAPFYVYGIWIKNGELNKE